MDHARRETTLRNTRKLAGQIRWRAKPLARTERAAKLRNLMRLKGDGALRKPTHSDAERLLAQFKAASSARILQQYKKQSLALA